MSGLETTWACSVMDFSPKFKYDEQLTVAQNIATALDVIVTGIYFLLDGNNDQVKSKSEKTTECIIEISKTLKLTNEIISNSLSLYETNEGQQIEQLEKIKGAIISLSDSIEKISKDTQTISTLLQEYIKKKHNEDDDFDTYEDDD